MALLFPSFSLYRNDNNPSTAAAFGFDVFNAKKNIIVKTRTRRRRSTRNWSPCCLAIAIDVPLSSLTNVSGIRWGSAKFQGLREEMEDEVVIRSDGIGVFSFAAVFDGHAGFSSVKFLRDELYKECIAALQNGLLLIAKDFKAVQKALQGAFESADAKLINWLEMTGEDVESGATATVVLIGNDTLFISHVGDSSALLSRSGKVEVLTNPHRPYGRNKVCLQEIKRIREAGGWIVNGRICDDISVSRAFGDMRFENKKNEMMEMGVEEGRWTEKFISRVQFKGDLVIASPDIFQVTLGSDAEFIILASDGLWDHMNSLDAANFVRDQLREHGDVQDRRSQDNVSFVITDLGQTDWRSLPQKKQNEVYEFGQAFATVGIVSLGIWMSSLLSF